MTTNKRENGLKLILVSIALVVMSGCSTLELAVSDEFKYGRIYAMKAALVEAVDSCEDENKVDVALYWARVGMTDLPEYMRYMGNVPGVTEQGRELTKTLRGLMQVKGDDQQVCAHLRQASLTSHQFTLALSGQSSIMVAANN